MLSEIVLDLKELIYSLIYTAEESKNMFDKYYDENVVYSNGRLINDEDISNYKYNIPLKYIIGYSTVKNLNYTYTDSNLVLTGDKYNLEYTLPFNVSSLEGLEFSAKINYETGMSNNYFIGVKNNQQNGINIGFLLNDSNISFIVGDEVVDTVSNQNLGEDLICYFKIFSDTENNLLYVAYHILKWGVNKTVTLFDDGFLTDISVDIDDLGLASYSFISYNQLNNGKLTLKSLEINDIHDMSEGLLFFDKLNLTSEDSVINIGESTTVSVTTTDQYNNPIGDKRVSFYLDSVSEENLLYTGVTDSDGEESFEFSSETENAYTIIGCVEGFPFETINIRVGIDIDMTNYIDLTIVGNKLNLTSNSRLFVYDGDGVLVDWGDGRTEVYTTGNLTHYYDDTDEDAEHNILIYGEIILISSNCFKECTELYEINLPDTITTLGNYCFDNCTNLSSVTLSENLTSLPNYCFNNCNKLMHITIPNNIRTLGLYCFCYCSNLSSVTLSENLMGISRYAFAYTNLANITLPNTITTLGNYCFNHCENLSSVTLSENLILLPVACFQNCTNLEHITLPNNIRRLDSDCFNGCSKLEEIIIPNNLISLGDYCFQNCTNLKFVDMRSNSALEDIGDYCFANAPIRIMVLPESLEDIGDYCFDGCSKLEIIFFSWTEDNDIIDYENLNLGNYNTDCIYLVPKGTPDYAIYSKYATKHYPLTKLGWLTDVFNPAFDGTTEVVKQTTNYNANTQSNGVSTFKGCVIKDGWVNTDKWILCVDVRYQGTTYPLKYTGLILLTNTITPFSGWGIRNWEGSVTRNPTISNGQGGTIDSTNFTKTPNTTLSDGGYGDYYARGYSNWYTLHMKKDGTILKVYKEFSDGTVSETVTYDWGELDDPDNVTIGGATNTYTISSASGWGSVAMKNLIVVNYDSLN